MIVFLNVSTKGKLILNFTRSTVLRISLFDWKNFEIFYFNYFLTTFRRSSIFQRINDFGITILDYRLRDLILHVLPGYSPFSYLSLSTQCMAICRSQMQLSPYFFDNCKIGRNSLKRNDEDYTEKLDVSSIISL